MHGNTRMIIGAEENQRIGFIIAQQHVITWLIQLDVVVFEEKRFGFRMSYGDVDLRNIFDQCFRFTAGNLNAKIAGKTLFKVFSFTYIDYGAAGVIHPVDARLAGDRFQKGFRVETLIIHCLIKSPY